MTLNIFMISPVTTNLRILLPFLRYMKINWDVLLDMSQKDYILFV